MYHSVSNLDKNFTCNLVNIMFICYCVKLICSGSVENRLDLFRIISLGMRLIEQLDLFSFPKRVSQNEILSWALSVQTKICIKCDII